MVWVGAPYRLGLHKRLGMTGKVSGMTKGPSPADGQGREFSTKSRHSLIMDTCLMTIQSPGDHDSATSGGGPFLFSFSFEKMTGIEVF